MHTFIRLEAENLKLKIFEKMKKVSQKMWGYSVQTHVKPLKLECKRLSIRSYRHANVPAKSCEKVRYSKDIDNQPTT